ATYAGDARYNTSTSAPLSQTNTIGASTTTLASSAPSGAVFGQSVTITATIAPVAPATAPPTGSVVFTVNGVAQAPVTLAAGQATLALSSLPVSATNTISASYTATTNFNGSTSAPLNQVVNKANSAITVTASPTSVIVGQSITFTATVAAVAPGGNIPAGSVVFVVDGV